MKKIFISVAVRGLDKEQTVKAHEDYRKRITDLIGEYEDISLPRETQTSEQFNGFSKDKPPVYWLGRGLMTQMSQADLVIICGDIEKTRGCKAEKLICELYGIPHLIIQ